MLDKWKKRAQTLKTEIRALYLAAKDPRVPPSVRILAAGIVAYALSPIDLIPDFLPLIGYLDDLVLLPLAIYLLVRLIPREVMRECRERAASEPAGFGSTDRRAVIVIVLVWIAGAALTTLLVLWRVGML